jgi:uncharacterized protein (TIGR02001 family)
MTATSSAVLAEESAWEVSGNVALSSEYVWRGIGQSASDPAISGGLDIAHESGFYAGTWASNVDYGDDASIEIDYYAGFGGDFGDSGVSYDVGGLYYDFPSEDYDAFEVYGFLSYGFVSAGISYSVDFLDADDQDDNIYYQLDFGHDVGMFSLAAGVGYYDFDDEFAPGEDSFVNYYVGISTEYAGVGFDLTYHDTNDDGEDFSGTDNDTVVFTISKSL